jgi:hypothetical protein
MPTLWHGYAVFVNFGLMAVSQLTAMSLHALRRKTTHD